MHHRYKWFFLIIFLAGFIILLLPDKGQPVIKINNQHGPSAIDLVGLSMMLAAWLASTVIVIRSWNKLLAGQRKRVLPALAFIYILSIATIIVGLVLSREWLLWMAVAVATIINITFIISAFRF